MCSSSCWTETSCGTWRGLPSWHTGSWRQSCPCPSITAAEAARTSCTPTESKLPFQQISEWLLLVVILSSIFILRSYFFFLLDNIFQFFIQFICFKLRIGSISSQFSISSIRSRLAEGILSLLFWPVYICSNSEMKHHDTFINLWVFLIWIHNLKE